MRWMLIIWFLFAPVLILHADPVVRDRAHLEQRNFNNAALQQLAGQKEFQYRQMQEPPKSLWDRFWSWFWWKVAQMLSTKSGRFSFWTVVSLVSAVVLGFVVWKVMGMNKTGLFARKSDSSLDYTTGVEDIHRISFEDAIADAIAAGNYRLATRLQYLQSLKFLSDRGYIQWQINKTNSDYLEEVRQQQWHRLFQSLTWRFEYTWYGETNPSADEFEQLRQQFQQLNTALS